VGVNTDLVIVFNEPVEAGSGSINIWRRTGGIIVGSISASQAQGLGTATITLSPAGPLLNSTQYYITIDATAFNDLTGNPFAGIATDTAWAFTTALPGIPVISSLSPANGDTGVDTSANLVIYFNEPVNKGTGRVRIFNSEQSFESIDVSTGQITGGGTTVITIDPSASLSVNTGYYVLIDAGAFIDLDSNFFGGISSNATWAFTVMTVMGAFTVTFNDLVTSDSTPDLSGTVGDATAEVTVTLAGQDYTATTQGNTWSLPGTSLTAPLSDSVYAVQLTAVSTSMGQAWGSGILTVDLTPPTILSLSPVNGGYATPNPVLSITFSEPVVVGTGDISLMESIAGPVEAIDVTSGQVTGWGDNQIDITPLVTLDTGGAYFVLISATCVRDAAGNAFPGITDQGTWAFSVSGSADIDSVTTTALPGTYGVGSIIPLTFHFAGTATLTGGNLEVTLETGAVNQEVVIEPFADSSSVTVNYLVGPGDSTEALSVLTVALDSGASLTSGGSPLVPLIAAGGNLSDKTAIGIDGVPPQILNLTPQSGAVVSFPEVGYELSEDVASGFVAWIDGMLEGAPVPAPGDSQMQMLSAADLVAGSHTVSLVNSNLVPGAHYTVMVSVTDSVGNADTVISTMVKITASIAIIQVSPRDTSVPLGGQVQFQAVGLDTSGGDSVQVSLDVVAWSATGPGSIDARGMFQAVGIGQSLVVGSYDSASDTAVVTIESGSVIIPSIGSHTANLGTVVMVFPLFTPAITDTVIDVSLMAAGDLPSLILIAGPTMVFEQQAFDTAVTLVFYIDTTLIPGGDLSTVQVYEYDPATGTLTLLESTLMNNTLTITTTMLGTYVVGIDQQLPVVSPISPARTAEAGQTASFSFTASDNVDNLDAFLHVRIGGEAQDSILDLDYNSGSISGSIPGRWITDKGLYYTVEIWDGANRITAEPVIDVAVEVSDSVASSDVLVEGQYQMISFPFSIENNTVEDMLHDKWGSYDRTRYRLFAYDSVFVEKRGSNRLLPGRAYWLQTRDFVAELYLDSADGLTTIPVSGPYAVPLRSGWNCISNPFIFSVSVEGLMLEGVGPAPILFAYENNLWMERIDITYLHPWRGYVVWNNPDTPATNVLISPWEQPPAAAKGAFTEEGYRIGVIAESGRDRDGIAVLGFGYADHRDGLDAGDVPKPGFFAKNVEVGIKVAWDSEQRYLTDYRGSLGAGQTWRVGVKAEQGRSVRLEFRGLEELPEGIEAVLWDEARERSLALTGSSVEYVALSSEEEEFSVLIGTSQYVNGEVKVLENAIRRFGLFQNAPNPFQAMTTVQYSLPDYWHGGSVRLEVYDLEGRLVRILVDGIRESGWHTVQWNGRNTAGRLMPAGTYIYRLRAGDFLARRKMLLLR
jgi:hypothetical protein